MEDEWGQYRRAVRQVGPKLAAANEGIPMRKGNNYKEWQRGIGKEPREPTFREMDAISQWCVSLP